MEMSTLNRVELIGHLGQDPEIRSTNSQGKVCNFTLATSEKWMKDGIKHEAVEWHRIVVFNEGLIEIIRQYCRKGSKVLVEGSLQTRKWLDKEGVDRWTTEIVLRNFNSRLLLLGDPRKKETGEDHDPDTGEVFDKAQQGPL